MIAFIDDQKEVHGVESICKVLPIAPSTYHDHVAKRIDPARQSARVKRDTALKPEVSRVFKANYEVYGARKVWLQLGREGVSVARCTVARLMKDMGLQGVIRGKPIRTTNRDKAIPCPRDHVNRQFFAPRPNFLWGKQVPATGSRGILHASRHGAALFMRLSSTMSLTAGLSAGGSA